MPEPLQFRITEEVLMMLIPRGGFGWVLDPRPVAPAESSECLLTLPVETEAAVDHLAERIREAGGQVSSPPQHQDWGYSTVCTDLDGHAWQIIAR